MICVSIWGSTFVVSSELMNFLSPIQLMSIRFAVACITLWIMRPKWDFRGRGELVFIIMAVFGNTLYFLAENTALTLTYSSDVSILVSTTTMMSLVLMWILKEETVTKNHAIGFTLSFIGVIFVILNGTMVLHIEPLGDLLALAAGLSWALYGLVLRRHGNDIDPFILSRKIMFYGFITTLPLMIIEGKPIDTGSLFTIGSIAGILFLAVLGSCICYIFWNNSIKVLGVVKSNMFLYLMPIVAMICGAIVLNENITIMALIGAALVISGLAVSNWHRKE